jgi:hypothetical protein
LGDAFFGHLPMLDVTLQRGIAICPLENDGVERKLKSGN